VTVVINVLGKALCGGGDDIVCADLEVAGRLVLLLTEWERAQWLTRWRHDGVADVACWLHQMGFWGSVGDGAMWACCGSCVALSAGC
jgi:hypothetical protein